MTLRIRKDQQAALARDRELAYIDRTARRLRESFPAEVERRGLDDDALRALAARGLDEGRRYGVVNEGDVDRYIECLLLLGPDFASDPAFPWAAVILRRPDLDGEARMDLIDDHLIFELRPGC